MKSDVRIGWRRFARLLLLTVLACVVLGCQDPTPRVYATDPGASDRFCILGDTRRPHPLNLWAYDNRAERRRLVQAVVAERPAFVLMSGDFVHTGASARQWGWFDRVFAPIRKAGIAVLPALGNHELLGSAQRGLRNYFARFPGLKGQRWYRRDWRGVAFLQLDSNVKRLSKSQWQAQLRWYKKQLAVADASPAVRGVVVTLHHTPMTNSGRHRDYPAVKQSLVPPFLAARKTMALVAGHVHTYERFVRQGKTFLNSGGGGAPRRRLLQGGDRPHPDERFDGPAVRPFHYVVVRDTAQGLAAVTRGVRRGERRLRDLERFTWPWPARTPRK